MLARELGIVVAGVATIAWLVGIVWRAIAGKRFRPRSRPAAVEPIEERRRTLRAIAAASYGQQATREPGQKERP